MAASNPDVPLEAVVKYLVKERDHYKQKMEQVAEYAKLLEARIEEMKEQEAVRLVDALRKDEMAEEAAERRIAKFAKKYKKAVGHLNNVINQFNQLEI